MVKLVFVLTLLVAGVTSDLILGQLPPLVISDVIGILTNGVRHVVGNCSNVTEPENRFLLYTRKNIDTPILLNSSNIQEVDPSKPIVCMIHGWMSSGTTGWPQDLKNTYLNETDLNAIVVDWSPYADVIDYTSACCHVPEVGKQLGGLLCEMNATLGVDLGTVHIVGHSLGGQVAGFTGQQVNSTCGQAIGRITGCDPAGPGFQDVEKSERLDSGDADFVDIIHSNAGGAGYYGQVGDVDFYPNCGTIQPGCLRVNVSNIPELLELPVSSLSCDHGRSYEYFIESVNSDRFKAKSCKRCPLICKKDILFPSKIIMGEHCPRDPPDEAYVLKTNSRPPYAKG